MSNILKTLAAGSASEPTDENFNQTTLLLHGDGTNGAQNNTFLDSSTNNFTITRNGNTTQGTFSPFSADEGKWSNYLSASGEYLSVPDSADWDIGSAKTIEAWVYLTTAANDKFIVGQAFQFWLSTAFTGGSVTSGKFGISFYNSGASWVSVSSTTSFTANRWYHVAASWDGTYIRLFIDGVLEGTSSDQSGTTWASSSSNTLDIGGYSADTSRRITGYVSNVRIVNSAVYTSSFTPITTPLTDIANTKLLTCQSNRFVDNNTQVSAKTVTVAGTPSVQPFSPFAPSAAYSTSVNGGSGYFDSSGDYLSFANDAAFNFTGDFCVEAWYYYVGSAGSDPAIVSISDASNDGFCGFSHERVLLRQDDGTNVLDYSYTALNKNAWSHLAVTRSGTAIKFFINGVEITSTTSSATISSSSTTGYIGSRLSSNGRANNYGYIGPVRIVNGSAVYTSAFTPPTAPPTAITNTVLLTNFTNAGIFDNTGKNNLETVGNAQIDTTVKKYGTGSMEFDGTGDYLVTSDFLPYNFGAGNFTIEMWVNFSASVSGAGYFLLARGPSAFNVNAGWTLWRSTSNTLRFIFSTDGTVNNYYYTDIAFTPTTGVWYHIAVTRDGSTFRMFIDGDSKAITTGSAGTGSASSAIFNSTRPLHIGASSDAEVGTQFNGFIDDLRITKGVARYTANFTPPTAPFPDE